MVSEYLRDNYPGHRLSTRVRLGRPITDLPLAELDESERALLQNYSRWADAVVFREHEIVLIEAKIRPTLGPLEALLLYRQLFLSDPQYKEHHNKPIRLEFVYAIEDPALLPIARDLGITPKLYKPKWLPEYLSVLRGRDRRSPRVI